LWFSCHIDSFGVKTQKFGSLDKLFAPNFVWLHFLSSLTIFVVQQFLLGEEQGHTQGGLGQGLTPLELVISQKLYYLNKGDLIVFAYFAC